MRQLQAQLDAVIRECLRFDPVAPVIFRMCEHDAEIGGATIKQGTLVCLLMKAAMFDPVAFERPNNFLIAGADRCPHGYLTFGSGPHQCRGEAIARPILRRVLTRLLLLKDLRRAAGPAGTVQYMAGTPLPDSMVVRFNT
jgi:cytochrome P450